MKGRKRHILVDHLGLLISAAVSVGNCGDRDGLRVLLYLSKQAGRCPKRYGQIMDIMELNFSRS
ncbi:MAG: hypothetical protein KFB95_03940 [Simkaniaceae bacterium]|nr:MAG: hypothetical protein KFB95_03920 [Simkaniaceae bacterium]QVL56566.1 MAG: hypothetical protein KFB95_03940 [Simkaniaceae bacterium]